MKTRVVPSAWFLPALLAVVAACSSNPGPTGRVEGQTEFVSAPMAGGSQYGRGGVNDTAAGGAPPSAEKTSGTAPERKVEETDLYRLEGDRLYFLNAYRGLMVFDVTDVDHPKLLGRSPIFGSPVEMIVRNGIATVVVADWYGALEDGSPFHGSIVRGLDATDPANIKVLGEAKLGGWVRDTRVVGDVLYAVSEDWGWVYGWAAEARADGISVTGPTQETIIVSSVSFAGGIIKAVGQEKFPGYGGVFNVTSRSILLAHDAAAASSAPVEGKTELLYLDISDPNGAIVKRGALAVKGRVQGWGADNGRWNLDFADGKTAHVVGCAGTYYWGCGGQNGYVLGTVDFTNPDAPVLKSELEIPSTGWGIAARFATNRLYLSPDSYSYGSGQTPFQVYDLTDPAAPKLAGSTTIPGTVWNILPAPNERLFALGNDWTGNNGSAVSLKYLDVTNPAAPKLIATSTFGQGWAWTPAAGTFKAFTLDAAKGLVVLPFSGWSYNDASYNNGLQLIEFTDATQRTAGAAKTRGWVERGIFVKTRLVSLSDLALSVIDYANHDAPAVVTELTLARNVVTAQPQGATLTEISSDWWDNDTSTSEIRILPIANAEESVDAAGIPTVKVDGVNASVFRNGNFAYVVTNVRVQTPCLGSTVPGQKCPGRAQQIQVVDLSNGGAVLRGKVQLPADAWGYYGWGWQGCYWYDWYSGAEVVQVGGDALAFRHWQPVYGNGQYVGSNTALYVVDLANADAPSLASVTVTADADLWWGNMKVVGQTLYTTHYEWFQKPSDPNAWTVKYYLDRIDLSDRSHPVVGSKINVPGLLIGGSESDPSILYTIDYRWNGTTAQNDLAIVRVVGNSAVLMSSTTIDGYVGQSFLRGNTLYFSAQSYDQSTGSKVSLHAFDVQNPAAPVDHASVDQKGWGWLLGVEGDRAIVTSGWGSAGVDIYKLAPGQAPQFSQFVRTRGWWANGVTRQNDSLFLASGYWGVQKIQLK